MSEPVKILVTGAAGFIGSNLVDRLLAEGNIVLGVDNLSTGRREFLADADKNSNFRFFERDLLDEKALHGILSEEVDTVVHLAANADVRDGLKHPRKDLEQNTIVTWNVLEAMRRVNVRKIAFSSTGSVYGEAQKIPTPEDCPFPVQTSLYGASKLAGESLISAYAEGYDLQASIFRFVSILGERYTHGHVIDFVRSLYRDTSKLRVLGDGSQRKSYLYVGDCVNAMLTIMRHKTKNKVEVFNLGTDEYVNVNQSIDVICEELKVEPKRMYTGGDRGWIGDNPFIFLDCSKLRKIGWKPTRSIRDSVRTTVRYLQKNDWLMQ
mgnify:CR=1 FL=1